MIGSKKLGSIAESIDKENIKSKLTTSCVPCLHAKLQTSALHPHAQKSKQLPVENHQVLMDVTCLWCWLKPNLKRALDASMMAKLEEMWISGLLNFTYVGGGLVWVSVGWFG